MKVNTFIKILRNLYKNKVSTLINLTGLSVGIAVVFLVAVYIHNELTADSFHKNIDNIYQLGATNFNGTTDMPAPLAGLIKDKVTGVDKVVRIDFTKAWGIHLKYNEQNFRIRNIVFADSTMFDIFSFKALSGNLSTALTEPGSIVLTQSLSEKIYGQENPIGKQLLLMNKEYLTVKALIEDVPNNSSLNFAGVISFTTLKKIEDDYSKAWGNFNYETFCTVRQKSPKEIEQRINTEFKKAQPERNDVFSVHAFNKLYLSPKYSDSSLKHGNKQSLIFLFVSAILILILAIVNFVNINLASIAHRLKTLGIHKVIGAEKKHIFNILLSETIFVVLISALIAFLLAMVCMPVFSSFTDTTLTFSLITQPLSLAIILVSLITLSVVAAYFPYIVINRQNIHLSLKKQVRLGKRSKHSRLALIAVQFTITTVLIISSIFINKQLYYINTKDLGYQKENTYLFFLTEDVSRNFKLLKEQLLRYPQFEKISLSHSTPGTIGMQWGGVINFRGEEHEVSYYSVPVTPGYLEMMGYEIKDGQFFNDSIASHKGGFILNETAVKEYGISEAPLEAKFTDMGNDVGRIIGVVKDFHFESFHEKIKPLAFSYTPQWGNMGSLVNIKSSSANYSIDLDILKQEYLKVLPDIPFTCFTIDNLFSDYYTKERNLNRMISSFSLLSIIIGCLGLIGIVNISIAAKIKEIGIRKVNGAKVSEILTMLNRDFIKWVAMAFVIACPIAWYAMNKWLENFAYKTTLSWWIFALSGVLALGIALLTVSFQSYKAATRNPIESLRYE